MLRGVFANHLVLSVAFAFAVCVVAFLSPHSGGYVMMFALLSGTLGLLGLHRLRRFVATSGAFAKALGSGQFSSRLRFGGGDLFSDLAKSLDETGLQVAKAVSELRDDKAKLEAVLRAMEEALVITDARGHLLLLNAGASRLLNLEPSECLGRALIEATMNHELDAMLGRALSAREQVEGEVALSHPVTRSLHTRFLPVADAAGQVVAVVAVFQDLTELRRLESVRRDFVANVSHELRTPVASLRAMTETLLAGAKEDPVRLHRYLKEMGKETERLSHLTNDLLDLAQLESSHEPVSDSTDVARCAGQVVQRLRDRATELQVQLELNAPEGLAVSLSAARLEQVLFNLVENAINFTPEDGSVTITGGTAGGSVRITVEDTGIGIAPTDLPRIFERFYRADPARSRETGGTGLGLAIVKHIIEGLGGGSVSVESILGQGTQFIVTLPLLPP